MSKALQDLRAASERLAQAIDQRRAATEQEIDECIAALEELRRAAISLPRLTTAELTECSIMMHSSLDVILDRVRYFKQRSRGAGT